VQTGHAIAKRLLDLSTEYKYNGEDDLKVYIYTTADINKTIIDTIIDSYVHIQKIDI
jgi:hypothetical protein